MGPKKEEFVLDVEKRAEFGTRASRRLRRAGRVPAVVYGHGKQGTALTLTAVEAVELESHAGMVKLAVSGRKRAITAVIKAMDRDPITGRVLHIDFQEVRMDEVIHSTVRVEPFGEPAGHQHGGQLEQLLHEIEIRCLPADLPESIRVDVSGLELDESLHVGELPLPEGIAPVADSDVVVFQVRLPRIAAVAEAEEAVAEGEEEAAEGEEEATEESSDSET
ncbi:MAG: 50S ribosomal protein L25 [Kiritimatiellaeota bacterium]|nr:50S ribosomal protein L25 [Kiritimatiellota bacterium]